MAYKDLIDPETGFQPSFVKALGWRWSSATGSEWNQDMPHCFQVDEDLGLMRFELRDTPQDRGEGDSNTEKRRAEISTVDEDDHMAHNGQEVWTAYLFKVQPWPAGMEELGSAAISISQMKWPSGSSPARGHRLTKDAFFRATKSGKTDNVKLYTGTVRMDDGKPHSIVERLVLGGTNGEWDLWLDGEQIVEFRGDIGTDAKDGYSPSYGWYGAPISGTLVIEYAELEQLSSEDLSHRISSPPEWPEEGGGEPVPEPDGAITCPKCGNTGTITWKEQAPDA